MFAVCLQLTTTHLVPHAIDSGLSSMKAALILSLAGGFSVFSRMASGMISDLVPVFLFIGGVLIGIYILQSLLIKDKNKED